MAATGSLLQLHSHNNYDILEEISDINGQLYYKGVPIYIGLSKENNNAIELFSDGIYVNGSYFLNKEQFDLLTKFDYKNNELYYDDIIVSREYDIKEIEDMINEIWNKINTENSNTSVTT